MHTPIDIFCQAGCYAQLNMGALACMELVSRRLQQNTEACAHGADAPNWASAKHFSGSSSSLDLVPQEMRSYASRLSRDEAELEHLRARAKTKAAGASTGVGAAQFWSEVFLAVPLVMVMRVRELDRTLGEAEGLVRRNDVSNGGGRPSDRHPQNKGRLAASKRGDSPLPHLQELPCVVADCYVTSTEPVALGTGCTERIVARGSFSLSCGASEDKNQCLRADVQQRVILAAMRWVDADSAVDGHEALAKLLKGRTGHAPWCLVQRRLLRVLAGQPPWFGCGCAATD